MNNNFAELLAQYPALAKEMLEARERFLDLQMKVSAQVALFKAHGLQIPEVEGVKIGW